MMLCAKIMSLCICRQHHDFMHTNHDFVYKNEPQGIPKGPPRGPQGAPKGVRGSALEPFDVDDPYYIVATLGAPP